MARFAAAQRHIHADERGETRFRDIEWAEEGPDGTTSKRFPATGIFTPGDWRFDSHTATWRHYVVKLDGPNQITASDGETRIVGTGEVILIEDVHGKGHLSQAVEGRFRHPILIPVD